MRSETRTIKINFAGITSAFSGNLEQCLAGWKSVVMILQVKESWNFICLMINEVGPKRNLPKSQELILFSLRCEADGYHTKTGTASVRHRELGLDLRLLTISISWAPSTV